MTSPIHSSSPSPLTQLIAIRHGETSWNRTARYQGQEDIALNEAGFSQAHDIAQALSQTPLDALYTSDLKRAYQTAAALALPAVCLPELREQHFGVFQGFTGTEIAQRWLNAWRVWHRPMRGKRLRWYATAACWTACTAPPLVCRWRSPAPGR